MTNETLLRKLRLIRDTVDDDPEDAANELDTLIEDLLDENGEDEIEAA